AAHFPAFAGMEKLKTSAHVAVYLPVGSFSLRSGAEQPNRNACRASPPLIQRPASGFPEASTNRTATSLLRCFSMFGSTVFWMKGSVELKNASTAGSAWATDAKEREIKTIVSSAHRMDGFSVG